MEFEVYHGTHAKNIAGIFESGLNTGSSFASDAAFAWSWKEDKVVAARLPLELLSKLQPGRRLFNKSTCTQYTIPAGLIIPKQYLRLMSEEELSPHIAYATSK